MNVVNIQSITDVITNSSSETFVIDTNHSLDTFLSIWNSILKTTEGQGYSGIEPNEEEQFSIWHTYEGDSIYEDNGKIHIQYYAMCNLGDEARAELERIFGANNIVNLSY